LHAEASRKQSKCDRAYRQAKVGGTSIRRSFAATATASFSDFTGYIGWSNLALESRKTAA
jgi:hypothetical protein